MTAGAVFQTVTPCTSSASKKCAGSPRMRSCGMTTRPPVPSSPYTSYTLRSNVSSASASTASERPTPKRSFTSCTVFDAPRCVMTTPFGWPVLPLVKMMYAVSSGV